MINFSNTHFAEGRLPWCNSMLLDRYKDFGGNFYHHFQAEA
jgi:hypothetical protein